MNKYVLGAVVLLAVTFGVHFAVAQGLGPYPVQGWSWSSNIGHIKFNHTATTDVQVDSSGYFSGYAFSSHVGFIKFGGLSGFPTGSGTIADNAKVNLTTGKLTGWARACAATVKGGDPLVPGDCSSMQSRTDGWDGWISLSGDTNNGGTYGVVMNTANGDFSQFAWGSDVVGWVSFNSGLSKSTCTGGCGGTPTAVNVSCSNNEVRDTQTGAVTVTYQATPSGGTGPYTYKWGSAAYSTNSTSNAVYTTAGAHIGPTITVMDSVSATSPVISCQNTIVTLPEVGNGLNLFIGARATPTFNALTLGSVGFIRHRAVRGESFVLKMANNLPENYSCVPSATLPTGLNGASEWSTWTNLTLGRSSVPVTIPTTDLTTLGTHTFSITCTYGGDVQTDIVHLDLVSSTQIEI